MSNLNVLNEWATVRVLQQEAFEKWLALGVRIMPPIGATPEYGGICTCDRCISFDLREYDASTVTG